MRIVSPVIDDYSSVPDSRDDISAQSYGSLVSAFRSAQWIWTNEGTVDQAPAGKRAIRKRFISPSGKTAVAATVFAAADNLFEMYVNGVYVGWSNFNAYNVAQRFDNIRLTNPSANTIVFLAENQVSTGGANPGGVLIAVQITYSDGSVDISTSDSSWLAFPRVPDDLWWLPDTDTSSWPSAKSLVQYEAGGQWGPVSIPPFLALTTASNWIWSSGSTLPDVPVGTRVFRKTWATPAGKLALSAKIVWTADDGFEAYVNGQFAASGGSWQVGYVTEVTLQPFSNLFAIRATNNAGQNVPNAGGALASIQILYSDGSSETVGSDASWRVNGDTPNFQGVGLDDSQWPFASAFGEYGIAPWFTNVVVRS